LYFSQANTEQYVQVPKSQGFTDGAWPPEVKTNEFADRQRLLRRIKSDTDYQQALVSLVKTAEGAIAQNNTIDVFEDYFREDEFEFESEPPSCKTIGVFK
jgi:dynein intermediate chain 2